MTDLYCRLKAIARAEDGQALGEYALLLTLVLLVGLPALSAFGLKLLDMYLYIDRVFASLMH